VPERARFAVHREGSEVDGPARRACSYDQSVFGDRRERRQNPHPQTLPGCGIALQLALIGIFGVMSYFVSRRTQAIGMDGELGATLRDVLGLVGKLGLKLAATGRRRWHGPGAGSDALIATFLCGVNLPIPYPTPWWQPGWSPWRCSRVCSRRGGPSSSTRSVALRQE
jgi:hypothetical protein